MRNNFSKLNLSGNSGNTVFCYKNKSGSLVVRKQSKNKIQSERLFKQYEKHLFFSKQKNKLFKVPLILDKGFINKLFYYEYGYVKGDNFLTFIKTEKIEDAKKIIDKFVNIIKEFSKNKIYFEKEYKNITFNSVLKNKITTNFKLLKVNHLVEDKLLKLLEKVKTTKEKTLSHGDFTFDNIIIDQEKNLWLIDFLAGFYPHYWLDIVRLFQNTQGEWYKIKYKMDIDKKKITLLDEYIKSKIENLDKDYMKNHSFFMALNFLRILPYMSEISEKNKVLQKIESFVNLS